MKPKFTVRVRSFTEFDSNPAAWQPAHYRALLQRLDYDDAANVAETDLKDMALMALQDKPPDDDAEAVLELRLGDRLTRGQRTELSHEMLEDTVWEEHADMSEHEELFHASTLLHDAFPSRFARAVAARIELELEAKNDAARDELADVTEPLLCRLLADGMSDRAILRRLFEDQIAGAPWPDAEHIVWTFDVERDGPERAVVTLTTTRRWAGDLAEARSYESGAKGDRAEDEDDDG